MTEYDVVACKLHKQSFCTKVLLKNSLFWAVQAGPLSFREAHDTNAGAQCYVSKQYHKWSGLTTSGGFNTMVVDVVASRRFPASDEPLVIVTWMMNSLSLGSPSSSFTN